MRIRAWFVASLSAVDLLLLVYDVMEMAATAAA